MIQASNESKEANERDYSVRRGRCSGAIRFVHFVQIVNFAEKKRKSNETFSFPLERLLHRENYEDVAAHSFFTHSHEPANRSKTRNSLVINFGRLWNQLRRLLGAVVNLHSWFNECTAAIQIRWIPELVKAF